MSRVVIERLTKRFDGKPPTVAVDDLSLEIEQGEFLVLLGPSGCGKTTTLRCLAGLETANEGVLTFGGQTGVRQRGEAQPVARQAQHRHGLPVVCAVAAHDRAQEHRLPVARPARCASGLPTGWVEEMAAVVDCSELLDRYPGQLSGGQQQRVALARGLVARPDLVLFDEPLSQPRRPPARAGPQRAGRAAQPPRVHGGVRHPRPERGAGARRPAGDHAPGRIEQLGHAPRRVRVAELRVRRRVHRHGQPPGADRARRRGGSPAAR